MDEAWMVLVMGFGGGFLGGSVAYFLEKHSRGARLPKEERRERDDLPSPGPEVQDHKGADGDW